jgi:hypothetical protein
MTYAIMFAMFYVITSSNPSAAVLVTSGHPIPKCSFILVSIGFVSALFTRVKTASVGPTTFPIAI